MDIEARASRVDAAATETERLRDAVDRLTIVHAREREELSAHVYRGRQLSHAIKGELQAVVGTLEILRAEGSLPTPHEREISEAIDRLGTIDGLVNALHALVRGMEPAS